MNGRHIPPNIELTLDLELTGVFVGGTVGRETVDGSMGVPSGSLPAAFATVVSNAPVYDSPSST